MTANKEKKPDKRTAYAERHKLTRTWINNDLKVFLEEGFFGDTMKESSKGLAEFLASDVGQSALMIFAKNL